MTPDLPHLELEPLIGALARHRVKFVITGSVAALAHGVDLHPGDLDITPALDEQNLDALSGLLGELGAKPKYVSSWQQGPSREACEAWLQLPATEANLDHRFVTPRGELDVVPRRAGTYDELVTRAVTMTAFGFPILVAHVDDLIVLCEKWDRDTDRRRMPALLAARGDLDRRSAERDIGAQLRRRGRS
jgi:hypothetical protein